VNSVEWTESGNFFIKRVAEFFIRKKEEKEGKKGKKEKRSGEEGRKQGRDQREMGISNATITAVSSERLTIAIIYPDVADLGLSLLPFIRGQI